MLNKMTERLDFQSEALLLRAERQLPAILPMPTHQAMWHATSTFAKR